MMTTTRADDPSAHDTAVTPPLCAGILAILNLFAHTTGTVTIDALTVSGIGHKLVEVPGGQVWHHLPPQVLELLEDRSEAKVCRFCSREVPPDPAAWRS